HHGAAPLADRGVGGDDPRPRGAHDLRDVRERPAPRAREPEPDPEPVESALVLPRAPGAAPLLPPDGRGRAVRADARAARPGGRALRGPEPEHQAGRSQDRDHAVHDAPDVRSGADHHRLLLPRHRLQLGLAVGPGGLLRAMTPLLALSSGTGAVIAVLV